MRRLLDAATDEFSEFGLAGARVDRIAERAGANKERLYRYFGNKEELFGHVLTDQLGRVMDAVFPIRGVGVQAVGDYAGRVFDYQLAHPELARLELWEGLQLTEPVNVEERGPVERSKVDAICAALPGIDRDGAEELLLTIVTLAIAWHGLHTIDRLITGEEVGTASRNSARRAAVVAAVESLAERLVSDARRVDHT